MKTMSNSKFPASVSSSNEKNKKVIKDREKRKSQSNNSEKPEQSAEKSSSNDDGNSKKYAGLSPESLLCYAEQTTTEHLSNKVCYGFGEDLSYKLRFMLNDAVIRARLMGRNVLKSSDVEETFEALNIDRIFGASRNPNWIQIPDQNFYYLDDQIVNLIEIGESDESYLQPKEVILYRQWLPELKEFNNSFKKYFENICYAIISKEKEIKKIALNDIRKNLLIGPIIDWFYNFAFFLLSKITIHNCLTLTGLELIRSLEENFISSQIVSEKQITLLVKLLLQRILTTSAVELLRPMCIILAIICHRLPLRTLALSKIDENAFNPKNNWLLPILHILNSFGIEAILQIFVPKIDYILERTKQEGNAEVLSVCLQIYNTICLNCQEPKKIHETFQAAFGDSIVLFWKPKTSLFTYNYLTREKEEFDWLKVHRKLIATRRKITHITKQKEKIQLSEIFSREYKRKYISTQYLRNPLDECKFKNTFSERDIFSNNKPKTFFNVITVKNLSKVVKQVTSFKENIENKQLIRDINMEGCDSKNIKLKEVNITIGKRTLLLSVLSGSKFKYKSGVSVKCLDHSLMYYNL